MVVRVVVYPECILETLERNTTWVGWQSITGLHAHPHSQRSKKKLPQVTWGRNLDQNQNHKGTLFWWCDHKSLLFRNCMIFSPRVLMVLQRNLSMSIFRGLTLCLSYQTVQWLRFACKLLSLGYPRKSIHSQLGRCVFLCFTRLVGHSTATFNQHTSTHAKWTPTKPQTPPD